MTTALHLFRYYFQLQSFVMIGDSKNDEEICCQPRLSLIEKGLDESLEWRSRIVGYIEKNFSGRSKLVWTISFFPKNSKNLWEQINETKYNYVSGEKLFERGEIRYPRERVKDAFDLLMQLSSEETDKKYHKALKAVGEAYLIPLENFTNLFQRQMQRAKPTEKADF